MMLPADTIQLHVNMLNDRTRTSAYLASITKAVRHGDVVLDIGTGTGVFAIAAARAGARHVYAIEDGRISKAARTLFEVNGVADRITLIRGWSTCVTLPERADVLIAELIGDDPLAEQVIWITRDAVMRLLKPDARLVPSDIKIFGVPVTIPIDELGKLTFASDVLQKWQSWYDIDFNPLLKVARESSTNLLFGHHINVYEMRAWKTLSSPVLLAHVDFLRGRGFRIHRTETATATATGALNGIIIYFELQINSTTFLSTRPSLVEASNHWFSPVRVLSNPIPVHIGDQLQITYWYRPWCGRSECEVRINTEPLQMAGNRGRRILAARNSRLAGGRGPNSFYPGFVR